MAKSKRPSTKRRRQQRGHPPQARQQPSEAHGPAEKPASQAERDAGSDTRRRWALLLAKYDSALSLLRRHWYITPLFALAFVVAILLAYDQCYLMNDNPAILADIKLDLPVSFMTVLMGKCLSLMYWLCPGVPWFGLFLYVVLWASLALILTGVLWIDEFGWLIVPTALLLLSYYVLLLVRVGFNAASLLSGASALFAFLVYQRKAEKPRIAIIVALGAFYSLSYLIRNYGGLGVVVFSLPVVAFAGITGGRQRIVCFALFFAPVVAAFGTNAVATKLSETDEVRHFKQFNRLRGGFHGFPLSRLNWNNKEILKANNWSNVDYGMLLLYAHVDEDKFNLKTLQNIYDHSVPLPQGEQLLDVGALREAAAKVLPRYKLLLICLLVASALSLRSLSASRISVCSVYAAYVVAGMVAMEHTKRFPTRIGVPFLIMALLLIVYLAYQHFPGERMSCCRRRLTVVVTGIAFAAFAVTAYLRCLQTGPYIAGARQGIQRYRDSLAELQTHFKGESVMIQAGQGLHYEFADPLHETDFGFKLMPLGYLVFSPRFYRALRDVGLEKGKELLPYLIDNPNAVVVFVKESLPFLLRFVRDTYGIDCKAKEIAQLPVGSRVYRLVSQPATPVHPTDETDADHN